MAPRSDRPVRSRGVNLCTFFTRGQGREAETAAALACNDGEAGLPPPRFRLASSRNGGASSAVADGDVSTANVIVSVGAGGRPRFAAPAYAGGDEDDGSFSVSPTSPPPQVAASVTARPRPPPTASTTARVLAACQHCRAASRRRARAPGAAALAPPCRCPDACRAWPARGARGRQWQAQRRLGRPAPPASHRTRAARLPAAPRRPSPHARPRAPVRARPRRQRGRRGRRRRWARARSPLTPSRWQSE